MMKISKTYYSDYNTMRVIIMYDLPSISKDDHYFYTKFHNGILQLGYIQIQESVYSKVIQSKTLSDNHIEKIKKIIPPKGKIRAYILTEAQYNRGIILSGEIDINEFINDDKRYKVI